MVAVVQLLRGRQTNAIDGGSVLTVQVGENVSLSRAGDGGMAA